MEAFPGALCVFADVWPPPKGVGAFDETGGYAPLDCFACPPPNGVGAFDDIGGNTAALADVAGFVDELPEADAGAFDETPPPNGVGAFDDIGGKAAELVDVVALPKIDGVALGALENGLWEVPVVAPPPNGVGAFEDIGGNAAELPDVEDFVAALAAVEVVGVRLLRVVDVQSRTS